MMKYDQVRKLNKKVEIGSATAVARKTRGHHFTINTALFNIIAMFSCFCLFWVLPYRWLLLNLAFHIYLYLLLSSSQPSPCRSSPQSPTFWHDCKITRSEKKRIINKYKINEPISLSGFRCFYSYPSFFSFPSTLFNAENVCKSSEWYERVCVCVYVLCHTWMKHVHGNVD